MARFRKLISNISPSRGSIATPRRSAALLGGSDLDDTLFGTTASDTLQGLGGNDTLYGDAGSDTLEGGTGADTLYGGAGIDFVSFATATAGVGVNLGFATGGGSGFGGEAVGDVYEGIEAIIGSPFDDILIGQTGASDTIYGGDGNDLLSGQGGTAADSLYGGLGLDTASYADQTVGLVISLLGTPGSNGSAAGDRLYEIEDLTGGSGNDTITGSNAKETLHGSSGNDILNGGLDADTLEGGAGADTLYGGSTENDDFVTYASSGSGVTIFAGAGSGGDAAGDVIARMEGYIGSAHDDSIAGVFGVNEVFYGGSGNDLLSGFSTATVQDSGVDVFYGGDGIDWVDYSQTSFAIIANLGTGRGTGGSAVNDAYHSIERLTGSTGNDTLTGSAAVDTLDGNQGSDTLVGGGGDDLLIGSAGNDTLEGRLGADAMQGGDGDDAVSWANAAAAVTFSAEGLFLSGGEAVGDSVSSVEIYIGSAFDDRILGTAFVRDTLYGGAGNDLLSGSGQGGSPGAGGQDSFGDVYYGGTGIDATAYSGGSGSVTVNLAEGRGTGGNAQGDRFFSIEHVVGSFENDVLIGSAAAETLDGFDADDTIAGGDGDDSLIGGEGNDTFLGSLGNDGISGGNGRDTMSWADAAAAVTYSPFAPRAGEAIGDVIDGIEVYVGSAHNDHIVGVSFLAETFYGGDGNDFLSGNGQGGTVGNGGRDSAGDTHFGGLGIDIVTYSGGSAAVTIDLSTGMGFGGNAQNDRYDSIEHVVGSFENDTLIGSDRADTLDGFDAHDTIFGGLENDWVIGGAGHDRVEGGAGNDRVMGGDGNDVLLGTGGGNDFIDGEGGDDLIDDALGVDTIFGGNGNDTVQYSAASYQLSGGAGADTLLGTGGADTIDLGVARFSAAGGGSTGTANTTAGGFDVVDLGDGNDLLYFTTVSANDLSLTVFGGAENDQLSMLDGDAAVGSAHTLYGGDGADKIWAGWFGMGGNSTVFGGNGDDFIYAGGGTAGAGGYDDTLYGGEGFDTYYWSPNGGGFGRDIIHDSSAGGNGLVIFSGNTGPAGGFPDTGSVDNDPVNGRVTLVDLGGCWFEIQDKDDASSAIRFRGGEITVINLQSRPIAGVPGENFIYTWDAVNGVWTDQNG